MIFHLHRYRSYDFHLRKLLLFQAIVLIFISSAMASTVVHATDVLIPSSQIIQDNNSKYFLISIGVDHYEDDFWPTLKWPETDARHVSEQFGRKTGLQIIEYRLSGKSASLNHVTNTLNNVAEQAREGDTVVLYVSGHGTLAQAANGELERIVVLQNTMHDQLFTTGLAHRKLQLWLDRLQARKKLMIFATCNSGEGKSRLPPAVQQLVSANKGQLVSLTEVSEGALVLAAAAKGEAARESDELKGDIYTHYLLEALNTYDRNKDGMVSALEAHDYARDRTWAYTQGRQRPTANAKFIGDADVVLYGKKKYKGLPVLEAYDERLAGFIVQIDNGEKGRLPFAFPLKKNGSLVRLYSSENSEPLARYKVKPRSGNSISLDQVMRQRPVNVGLGLRHYSWTDNSREKIIGSSSSLGIELNAGYHWYDFGLGLSLGGEISDSDKNLSSSLRSSADIYSALLLLEYRRIFYTWSVAGRLELGSEQMAISVVDDISNSTREFSDNSLAYGASLILGYRVISDFYVNLETGLRTAQWQFNDFDYEVDGTRFWFGLGVDYRFGWRARTLW